MAGGEKLVILAILIAAASGAGYAGRTHWVSKPKAVPPIVRALDREPTAADLNKQADEIAAASYLLPLAVARKRVHVDQPRPDPHAALERVYRANLAREGLAPVTTHLPIGGF